MTSKKKTTMNLLSEKGSILIELLVTIVILVIIACAVPSVVELLEKAKEEDCLSNGLELRNNYLTYI
jgi:Tfp pilus assembly protein FimT